MSTHRAEILSGVRRALGRESIDAGLRKELDARIAQLPKLIRPKINTDLVEQFCSKLRQGSASVQQVDQLSDVVAEIKNYLAQRNLPARLIAAPALQDQDWAQGLDMYFGASTGDDLVSLTPCVCAIAETGSVVLFSDAQHPTTLNFLPDHHIVVVRQQQLVAHLEDAWPYMRSLDIRPRTVNFITGPSKTADVEQTLQIGAHGPRSLHVVFVNG